MWHGSEYGMGIGWGWIVVPIIIIFLIWVVYKISKLKTTPNQTSISSSDKILNKRYANGEISEKEYNEIKKNINKN
jgi:uncharacterized membrane protein